MSSPLKSSSPALVSGATGRHGATGPRIARLLLEQGLAVRGMVHRLDEHSSNLVALGVEVVIARERRGRSKPANLKYQNNMNTKIVPTDLTQRPPRSFHVRLGIRYFFNNRWSANLEGGYRHIRSSFYGGNAHGYTDYPFHEESESQQAA